MKTSYNIALILPTELSKEVLMTIFNRGINLGFRLMSKDEYSSTKEIAITPKDAANRIFNSMRNKKQLPIRNNTVLEEQEMRNQDNPCIDFSLYVVDYADISHYNMHICDISICPRHIHSWYKEPDFIDFDRYIRLLFFMCQDFQPLWLHTSDGGYSEEFYWVMKDYECTLRKQFDLTVAPEFHVVITILADYTREVLQNLLNHGMQTGWTYSSVSVDQAVDSLLNQPINHNTYAVLCCAVDGDMYELSFRLRFNQYLCLMLRPVANTFDLKRTALHALDLCVDFTLAEVYTFDARYNYMYIHSL